MAKNVNIQFSGRIGPLVGCLRYGKYYYRSRSAKVRQTKATIQSSNNFGLASKAGKIMRLYLASSIPNTKDGHMHKRLAGTINKWLGLLPGQPPQPTADIPFVNHFNFNPELRLTEKLRMVIGFTQTGNDTTKLQLPAFVPAVDVKAPAGTTQLQFYISTLALRLGDDACYGSSSTVISIPYNHMLQHAQELTFNLPTRPGNILIAALQLRYGVQLAADINYTKHAAKSVAAIVGALYV